MIEKTGRVMLTARGIASLPPGSWAANPIARGVGVLQVRKLEDGKSAFYYRYTRTDQKRYRLSIGTDIDLAAGRRRASDLSARCQAGDRNLREILEAEAGEKSANA